MKKFEIVKLINNENYKNKGLYKNLSGIVINTYSSKSEVLFFNEQFIGDAILVIIENKDLVSQNEFITEKLLKDELNNKINKLNLKQNDKLKKCKFKEYDVVKLIIDKPKYLNLNLHKDDIGIIIENKVIQNKILVDFSKLDENNNIVGDPYGVLINIEDLEKVKN